MYSIIPRPKILPWVNVENETVPFDRDSLSSFDASVRLLKR